MFFIVDLKDKMDLYISFLFVGIIFMLCCGFVYCDIEDVIENVELVMIYVLIVLDFLVG